MHLETTSLEPFANLSTPIFVHGRYTKSADEALGFGTFR